MPSHESSPQDERERFVQLTRRQSLLEALTFDPDQQLVESQLRNVPLPAGFMDRARAVMADAYDPALDHELRAVDLPCGYVDRLRQLGGEPPWGDSLGAMAST